MGGIEDFKRSEMQVDLIVALDTAEDMALIESGYGRYVDLYSSNQFHLEVADIVYGLKGQK